MIHRSLRVTALALALAALVALVALVALTAPAVAARPAVSCPQRPTGVTARHPVVLVHGFTGGAEQMRPAWDGLGTKITRTAQAYSFDYHRWSTRWAADPQISWCLAAYINDLSDRNLKAGGDGLVYVVAHSMGGMATRFATDRAAMSGARVTRGDATTAVPAVTARRLGGLVTIGTPHRGTSLGSTVFGDVLGEIRRRLDPSMAAPDGSTGAVRCMSTKVARPSWCADAEALPSGVPIAELGGNAIVRRSLFGHTLYDIPTNSDGLVPLSSAHGYRPPATAAAGAPLDFRKTRCVIDTDNPQSAVIDAILFRYGGYINDWTTYDRIADEATNPDQDVDRKLAAFRMAYGFVSSCGHNQLLKNPGTLKDVTAALGRQIESRSPTDARDLSAAPVPALCRHPAGRLVDGSLPGLADHDGYVSVDNGREYGGPAGHVEPQTGDMTGDGTADIAAVIGCSAGGVSWPDTIGLWGPGTRLLGHINLIDHSEREHATINTMTRQPNGNLSISYAEYDGAGFDVVNQTATAVWSGGRWRLRDIKQMTGPMRRGTVIDASGVADEVAFTSTSGHVSCDMRAGSESGDEPASVRCDVDELNDDPGPAPDDCTTGWGTSVQLSRESEIICAGDTVVMQSDLSGDYGNDAAVAWFDQASDPVVRVRSGTNDLRLAGLRQGWTLKLNELTCTSKSGSIDVDAPSDPVPLVVCDDASAGTGFSVSPDGVTLR